MSHFKREGLGWIKVLCSPADVLAFGVFNVHSFLGSDSQM